MSDLISGFIGVVVLLLMVGGYIANFVKLIMSLDGGVTALFVARCFGVFFAPLGSVLGFF